MANLSVSIPGMASPFVASVGTGEATPPPSPSPTTMVPDTLPAMPMPDILEQSTDIDLGEAAVPTEAEPLPFNTSAGRPQDVYVAPMSTKKQKLWQKLMCIGCCVREN